LILLIWRGFRAGFGRYELSIAATIQLRNATASATSIDQDQGDVATHHAVLHLIANQMAQLHFLKAKQAKIGIKGANAAYFASLPSTIAIGTEIIPSRLIFSVIKEARPKPDKI